MSRLRLAWLFASTIAVTAAIFFLAGAQMSGRAEPSAQVEVADAALDPHAGHLQPAYASQAAGAISVPDDGRLPPSSEGAKARLERTPRHGEWVDIPVSGSPVPLRTWVAYPERRDKAPVAILIHTIYGLNDGMRGIADQMALEGFIAVVPDMVSGRGPGGGGTESAHSRDDLPVMVRGLTPADVTARLDAVFAYAKAIPAANGKIATVGFCWGGTMSFAYATTQPALGAAIVYYGTSPETGRLAAINAPVLGLYGSDDARVNVTIDPAKVEMRKRGKVFETNIYEGAGHGFLGSQADRSGANLKATQQAWPTTIAFLRKHLGESGS